MLDQITPIVLTYNEAPNIRRTLEAVSWARDVVVVDSFSDDATLTIPSQIPHVRTFQRRFDCHQNQWNFALKETGITSEWVLALDADYVVTPELVEELKALQPPVGVNGYKASFVYCVHGKPLRGSAYPPVAVLYRRDHATYRQDGHTQRVLIHGEVRQLYAPILHDDRKPLTHWLKSQDRYMRLEVNHLREKQQGAGGAEQGFGRREATPSEIRDQRSEISARPVTRNLGLPDRLRKTRLLFPFVIFFYCLFVKGAVRDGWAGVYYALQRMLAEILLALYLIEDDIKGKALTAKDEQLSPQGAPSEEASQWGAWSMEQGAFGNQLSQQGDGSTGLGAQWRRAKSGGIGGEGQGAGGS